MGRSAEGLAGDSRGPPRPAAALKMAVRGRSGSPVGPLSGPGSQSGLCSHDCVRANGFGGLMGVAGGIDEGAGRTLGVIADDAGLAARSLASCKNRDTRAARATGAALAYMPLVSHRASSASETRPPGRRFAGLALCSPAAAEIWPSRRCRGGPKDCAKGSASAGANTSAPKISGRTSGSSSLASTFATPALRCGFWTASHTNGGAFPGGLTGDSTGDMSTMSLPLSSAPVAPGSSRGFSTGSNTKGGAAGPWAGATNSGYTSDGSRTSRGRALSVSRGFRDGWICPATPIGSSQTMLAPSFHRRRFKRRRRQHTHTTLTQQHSASARRGMLRAGLAVRNRAAPAKKLSAAVGGVTGDGEGTRGEGLGLGLGAAVGTDTLKRRIVLHRRGSAQEL